MTKQSRLRVHNGKRGRRILLSFVLVGLVGLAGWYLEQKYLVITSCRETLASITKNLTPKAARRGEFYDRNLKQIAINKERVSVYIRTQELESIARTVSELASILSLDEEALKTQLEGSELRHWIAEDISQDQEIALKAKQLSGVYLQREEKRVYPNKTQAAHLVGYVENGIGLAGVEFFYDRNLATGRSGTGKAHFNSSQDLVLTLDLKIQDVLDGLVEEIKKHQNANKVLAYIMESRTGAVIGGAQLPGFDPNSFTQYSQETLDSQFVSPILLPNNYRLFLRDAAILQGQSAELNNVSIPWSLRSSESNLGSQLQLWERLGLNEKTVTDFRSSTQTGEIVPGDQRSVVPAPPYLEMVPEQTTPLNLLTAFSVLLNNGEKIRPFVVQKSLDIETGAEIQLLGHEADKRFQSGGGDNYRSLKELFSSMARAGEGNSLIFNDKIVSEKNRGGQQNIQVNELLLVTIPAGENDMTLLVVVAHDPVEPSPRNAMLRKSVEEIVEEKVERISILQQVANSVADVVEPEFLEDGNYQEQRKTRHTSVNKDKVSQHQAIMPDLLGLSLRKSLRLLQGIHIKISIQGTGKVVSQKPLPGTPLKETAECTVVLEKGEEISVEKLSKNTTLKK